jgi:hypothetical protein
MNNHLTPKQLLAYVDGELSRPETRRAEEHVRSCWTCLAEMERLKHDIATILDAQNESFSRALPPPPQPWPGFKTVLARSLPARPGSVWLRFGAYRSTFFAPTRILVVSGIVAVLLVGVYSIFRTKTVSAKEVLQRIEVADTQRSTITKDQVIREQVHIRKTTHGKSHPKLTNVDTWKSPTATYWNVTESDSAAADLKAQYQAHSIPVGLPLSAASVDSWGKAAGGKPTVSQEGSDIDLSFAGSTDGAAGSVERVSLLVRPESWQVKQMTLDFADASFEVAEEDYSVMPTSAVPADLLARLEPEVPPSMIAQPVTGMVAGSVHLPMVNLEKAELDALTTLHTLKADLGEPVTVTRSSHAVQVGIWQLPRDRQNELRAALSNLPGVQVVRTAPRVPLRNSAIAQTTASLPATSGVPLHVHVESGADDQRLLKFFGSSEREQDFTNNALATSTSILSHLYALRILQGQFPAEKSQSLAPEEQTQLRSLVQDHSTAISANVDALSRQLTPLDVNFSVTPCTSSAVPAPMNWQRRSLEALETARTIDRLLRALLTTSQAPAIPDAALPEINQNLCHLRGELRNLSAAKDSPNIY